MGAGHPIERRCSSCHTTQELNPEHKGHRERRTFFCSTLGVRAGIQSILRDLRVEGWVCTAKPGNSGDLYAPHSKAG